MNIITFEAEIMNHLKTVSGLEERRGYIGISNIGKCLRRAYLDITQGQRMSDDGHRMCYVGYMFERDALARLAAAELARPSSSWQVIAPWDARVRGHTDANTSWGDLLEIKSVSKYKYDLLLEKDRPLREHADQVQLYMRYGSWKRAWILYICRETFEHRVFEVRYDGQQGEKLEARMKALVQAVDEKKAPVCECHRCR